MSQNILSFIKQQLSTIKNEELKLDSLTLLELMLSITKETPKLWNKNMVGFGTYHYKYESGREGEWFLTGFCPRKNYLAVYIIDGFEDHKIILDKLGKFKIGASCLYINSLQDVDMELLEELITKSYKNMLNKYIIVN